MDLSITVNGIKFPNPFLLGSGPPGTNGQVALAQQRRGDWVREHRIDFRSADRNLAGRIPTS